jgi:hypothetical protein
MMDTRELCRTDPQNDQVNHPPHYTFGKYEVIDVLEDWFYDDPLLWQVGKYISRAKHKGKMLEDLKKARFYLNRRIEKLEGSLTHEERELDPASGAKHSHKEWRGEEGY